jgi:hypothetical protein
MPLGAVTGKPHRLTANRGKSFIGHYVLGMGFLMDPAKAKELIKSEEQRSIVSFSQRIRIERHLEFIAGSLDY